MKYTPVLAVLLILAMASTPMLYGQTTGSMSRGALLENGIRDFQEKRFEKAVFWFTQLIDLEPFSAKAYKNRAAAHMELEHFDEAIQDLTRAINLEPELQGLHNNLGVAWYSKKDYGKAIDNYTREIELNPDRFTTYFNRAMALADSGANDRALEDLAMVIKLDPGNAMALAYTGDVLEKTGQTDKAVQTFKTVLEMDPGNDYAQSRLTEMESRPQKEPAPITPPEPEKEPMPAGNQNLPEKADSPAFTVQTGAFHDPENAQVMLDQLNRLGHEARVVRLNPSHGPPWYLVRIGRFNDRNQALDLVKRLKEKQGISAFVRPVGSL